MILVHVVVEKSIRSVVGSSKEPWVENIFSQGSLLFKDNELDENSVIRDFRITAEDGTILNKIMFEIKAHL